jgi:hypothetical protein
MKKHRILQHFTFFLLTAIATSCSNPKGEHERFLKENGIEEINKVPMDYSSWKPLAGDYVYHIDLFKASSDPEMIYIVANTKEKKMIGLMHINRFIMPAALAPGVIPATTVTNYEEIHPQDINKANDMTEFNSLLKAIPEMKDFQWKNKMQNQIASGIILKTNFIYVTKSTVDDKLFSFSEKPQFQDHDKVLKDILKDQHIMYNRDVQRLNKSVEMGQYISLLGFTFDKTGAKSMSPRPDKFYINDLVTDNPIDFTGKGKMFFFIPFKAFLRTQTKGETPVYYPAIETYEYTHTPDNEGFPVFKRSTHFASLLEPALAQKQ